MEEQICILYQNFLIITKPRLGVLARMQDNPDIMERVLNWFTEVMKASGHDEFEFQWESLFRDLFERYRKESESDCPPLGWTDRGREKLWGRMKKYSN